MPLTYDQQKNIRSLIDNAGAGTYEEVRDELYDHLVQAVEGSMARGNSFTDAQQEALEEMGGEAGLVYIKESYVRTAEKQVWRMFRYYAPTYLKSLRWLIPLALGLAINQYTWVSVVAILGYFLLIPPTLGNWWIWTFDPQDQGTPVSLRLYTLKNQVAMFIPAASTAILFMLNGQDWMVFEIVLLVAVFTISDYCLAFVRHARKNWLEIA